MKFNNLAPVPINNTLFSSHAFTEKEKERVFLNNVVIDWFEGNQSLLRSVKLPGKAVDLIKELEKKGNAEIKALVDHRKNESLLMTTIFLSGKCDANCEICYTDRKASSVSMNWVQLKEIIIQVSKLGNKTIYIPGEGEPFLDNNIFDIIKLAKEYNQNIVIFTDGLLLSDERRVKQKWGMTLEELDRIITDSPVYLYFKYWHTEKNMFATMMRIHPDKYKTESVSLDNGKTVDVPSALLRLYKIAPEKIGIETAIHSLNYNDVLSQTLPFVREFGIKWYLEPIIHSGRYFSRHEYDLTPEQYVQILPYLTKQQCKRTGFSATITTSGHLSFCPSFVSKLMINDPQRLNDISVIDKNNNVRDIFSMLHTSDFIVESRYNSFSHSCLCEYYANQKESSIQNPKPVYEENQYQNTT